MSQMPEIKGVINKEPNRDKKKAGLLARLFGGGGSGGSGLGGVGGFGGGASGGLGGLAGGGILATKAGLIALILAGTTVAGGIGMIGYRLFGPGASDSAASGDNLQLFSPKPKDAASADGQGAAAKDGTSASLQYLNQANKTPAAGDAAANGATSDATAAGAAGGSASAAAGGGGAINKIGDTGNGVSKAVPKIAPKFGTLTGAAGGGGSGAAASSAPKSAGDFAAGSKGSLSGFKKTAAASVSGGTARTIAGRHIMGAAQDAFTVQGQNSRSAPSSALAGAHYDGAASGGSNISGAGTPIGGAGTAAGGGAPAQPTSLNAPANANNTPNIPTPAGQPLCPWQNAIKTAQMLLALGGMLLFVMSMLHSGPGSIAKMIIGSIVAAVGAAIIAIGAQVATGQYGQKLQGGVLAAAGAGLTAAAIWAMMSDDKKKDDTKDTKVDKSVSHTTDDKGVSHEITDTKETVTGGADKGFMAGINPYVLLGGGAVLIGVAGTMMAPPTTYPPSTFHGNPPPDLHMWGYQELPSETALKKMVA